MTVPQQRLDQFDSRVNYDPGRSRLIFMLWYACKMVFFLSPFPWPSRLKGWLLRRFGARVGQGVVIKPRVNIHLPWRLVLGDHVWIGEEVFLLNFAPVTVGDHVCLSQRAFLCTGSHDFRSVDFRYRHAPITIGAEAWICAQTFVGPGVTVGPRAVLLPGASALGDQPPGMICGGVPAAALKPRDPASADP